MSKWTFIPHDVFYHFTIISTTREFAISFLPKHFATNVKKILKALSKEKYFLGKYVNKSTQSHFKCKHFAAIIIHEKFFLSFVDAFPCHVFLQSTHFLDFLLPRTFLNFLSVFLSYKKLRAGDFS